MLSKPDLPRYRHSAVLRVERGRSAFGMTTGADNSSHNNLFTHPPLVPPARQPQPRDIAAITLR